MNPFTLFEGVTDSNTRKYIVGYVKRNTPDKIVLPCIGSFSVASALVRAGVDPDIIHTSDFSLFSTIIGYTIDVEKDIQTLNLELPEWIKDEFRSYNEDKYTLAATCLFLIHFERMTPTNGYMVSIRRELKTNMALYIGNIRNTLESMAKDLAGVHYERQDVREVLLEETKNSGTFIYLTPPSGNKQYTKAYEQTEIHSNWQLDEIDELQPKELYELFDNVFDNPAQLFIWSSYPERFSDKWNRVAVEVKGKRKSYILTNVETERIFVKYPIKEHQDLPYPIYSGQDITEDSVIEFRGVKANEADHYRDLFVHGLGATSADINGVMLIDGRVTTVFGLNPRNLYIGVSDYIYEIYGISITVTKYMRIGKLFMMMLTSIEFYEWLCKNYPKFSLKTIKGIMTTSPTKKHEGKTDRGVMKLVSRIPDGDGFKLQYQAEWNKKRWKELLKEWLRKWGHKKRG